MSFILAGFFFFWGGGGGERGREGGGFYFNSYLCFCLFILVSFCLFLLSVCLSFFPLSHIFFVFILLIFCNLCWNE